MVKQRNALTKIAVEKAHPEPGRQLFLWDSKVPGFGVRIFPSGRRKYIFQYRTQGRRQRRMVLGVHGPLTPEKARGLAADLYELVRKGGDPMHDQQLAARRKPDTIENVIDQFVDKYLKHRQRAQSYIDATRAIFDNHVIPRWRRRDIKSITRRDLIELLDRIVEEGKPTMANRTLAAVRKLFNWALQRDMIEMIPFAMIEKPSEETKRERTLAADELKTLWPEFDGLGYPFGPFFKLALLTGQRRSEIAGIRWADVNEGERAWTLPSEMTKAGRTHVIPLSSLAMGILAEAKEERKALLTERNDPQIKNAATTEPPKLGPYVFTTNGERPISGYGKAKIHLDKAIAKARSKAKQDPLLAWTIHDLRRTVATGLGRLGISRFVIARMLNHADRSVTGIYDKYEYLDEKRHALESWAHYLGNLFAPQADNVEALRTAAE